MALVLGAWVVNGNAYDFCIYIAEDVGSWAPPIFDRKNNAQTKFDAETIRHKVLTLQ
jgi:hypothetical protein